MLPPRCARRRRFAGRVAVLIALALVVLARGLAAASEPELQPRREDRGDLIVLHLRGSYCETPSVRRVPHPEYTDKFIVVPLAERIAAGLERPQAAGEFPRLGDLQYVPH